MGRAFAIDPSGLRWRPLFGRERLLAWDDVERLDDNGALGVRGERVTLPASLMPIARTALAGPDAGGEGLARYLTGPHGPRLAARALIAAAEAANATDVHLEPSGDAALVRFRLEGVLETWATLPAEGARRLTAALKGLAGCLPYRLEAVQEGRIPREGIASDIRASFVPAALGDRVALRLFGRLRSLDDLGFDPPLLARLRELFASHTGLVLVAGSTGAGKTTTLYAALSHLAMVRPGAHLSLEDPVEQRLRVAGVPVDQIELDPARGRTGEAMLAAALRQDVDVLSVGEIRTCDEATLAVRAAHTGRLVLAGVHAGSCDEARQRLLDLGVDGALLQSTLRGVLHQSLVVESLESGRRRRLVAKLWTAPAPKRLEVVA